jgi:hypothetical protein
VSTSLKPVITSVQTWNTWDEGWYPTGPRSFAKRARAAGWEARIGFARGYVPGARADVLELRDTIGVWVDGYGHRAVALWERNPEAEFSARKLESGVKPGDIPSGMHWATAGTMIFIGQGACFPYANLTELEEWILLRAAVLPSWYGARRQRVFTARRKAKGTADAKVEREAAQREIAARMR